MPLLCVTLLILRLPLLTWAMFSLTFTPPWLAFLGFLSLLFIERVILYSSAWFARHISNDVIWIEDPPPQALESLYFDLAHIVS